jgi:hypothetical protein
LKGKLTAAVQTFLGKVENEGAPVVLQSAALDGDSYPNTMCGNLCRPALGFMRRMLHEVIIQEQESHAALVRLSAGEDLELGDRRDRSANRPARIATEAARTSNPAAGTGVRAWRVRCARRRVSMRDHPFGRSRRARNVDHVAGAIPPSARDRRAGDAHLPRALASYTKPADGRRRACAPGAGDQADRDLWLERPAW